MISTTTANHKEPQMAYQRKTAPTESPVEPNPAQSTTHPDSYTTYRVVRNGPWYQLIEHVIENNTIINTIHHEPTHPNIVQDKLCRKAFGHAQI